MSWDLMIFAEKVPSMPDWGRDDFEYPDIGDAQDVRDTITLILPETNWRNPSQGFYEINEMNILFNIEEHGLINHIDVEASFDLDPLPVLKGLCREAGWCLFDMVNGEFVDC